MKTGTVVIVNERGEIVEESTVVIEDGTATTLCKDRRYIFNWDMAR